MFENLKNYCWLVKMSFKLGRKGVLKTGKENRDINFLFMSLAAGKKGEGKDDDQIVKEVFDEYIEGTVCGGIELVQKFFVYQRGVKGEISFDPEEFREWHEGTKPIGS